MYESGMKVLFLPSNLKENPYQFLLSKSLRKLGIEVESHSMFPSERWLFTHRKQIQILHLHWPSWLYALSWMDSHNVARKIKNPVIKTFIGQMRNMLILRKTLFSGMFNLLVTLRECTYFVRFLEKLFLAWLLGYKIIWTMHNLMPHEPRQIDILGRFAIVMLAHAVVVHCKYAKKEAAKRFFRKKNVYVIPHGNYVAIYPNSVSKEEARTKLDIHPENAFIYLYFGAIRPYKQVEKLINAFERLNDRDSILLIAGICRDIQQKKGLIEMAEGNRQIKMFVKFIPDENVQYFFAAADVLVVPYSEVLTSGSVILGLSFGIPVITPALGCLSELVSPKCGILYDPHDEDGLLNALKAIKNCNVGRMSQEAYRLLRNCIFDWDIIAAKTRQVYLQANRKYDITKIKES